MIEVRLVGEQDEIDIPLSNLWKRPISGWRIQGTGFRAVPPRLADQAALSESETQCQTQRKFE
jgi:hypothetical protein